MFVEIKPYEKETLSVRFKANREDFSKILQAIKKVPGRVWVSERCLWTIPADRNSCNILLNNIYSEGFCRADSGFIGTNDGGCEVELRKAAVVAGGVSADSIYLLDILDKLEEIITATHYSKRTREAYSYWISRFVREHKDKNLKTFSDAEINSFVSCLATKEKIAASSQNQALAALLFLYKNILGLAIQSPENIIRAKKSKKLPAVLSREETAKIFSLLPENDYGLFIRLLYGRYNFGSCNTAASLTDEFAMRQTSHMIHARSAYEFSTL